MVGRSSGFLRTLLLASAHGLQNSRTQEKHKACKGAGVPGITQDTSVADPGLASTSNTTREQRQWFGLRLTSS